MTRIIRDIRFGTVRIFLNSRSPPQLFFPSIVVPSCLHLAPLPAPVHYVVGHRVRVRERYSRLSCIRGPFGRLSGPRPPKSHLGPWPRWRNLSGGSGASIDDWVFSFSTSGSTTSSSLLIQIVAACSHLLYTYVYAHVGVCVCGAVHTDCVRIVRAE